MTQQYGDWQEKIIGFIAGLASGITKSIVGHPFDTIKLRMQTEGVNGRFKGPLDCTLQTLRNEGLRGFYKGALPPLLGWMIMDSVMLGSLTNFRFLLAGQSNRNQDGEVELTYLQHAIAGFGSGCCVCFVATPIELTKAQLQVQYDPKSTRYSGPTDVIRSFYKNNGPLGLYRGLSACLLFRSFFSVLWSSFEYYKKKLSEMKQLPPYYIPFLAGGFAATTFWIIAFPTDVIKNRIMSQPDQKPLRYPSIRICVLDIYRNNGIRGFYRGFLPCMLRSFPTNGAALLVFDNIMRLLRRNKEIN